jgi:hypothetical protein
MATRTGMRKFLLVVFLIGMAIYIAGHMPSENSANVVPETNAPGAPTSPSSHESTRTSQSDTLTKHSESIINAVRTESIDTAPQKARWEGVDAKFEENGFTLTIWYREDPFSGMDPIGIIEYDTKFVVRAVIKELISRGYHPDEQNIKIHAFAMRHITGETGKQLVQEYGFSSYNKYTDSIDFKKCNPASWLGC